jgi:hypothetical protein
MVRGAPKASKEAALIAASIRTNNAWRRFQGTVDFASAIHSQALPLNRKGALGQVAKNSASLSVFEATPMFGGWCIDWPCH